MSAPRFRLADDDAPIRAGSAPGGASAAFRPLERIVVPVAGSDREFLSQQWAVELAAALGLPIRGIHVAADPDGADPGVFRFLEREARKWGVVAETVVLAGGDVVEELVLELTVRDLVVVGTRNFPHGYHVGSVAEGLVRRAPCPVQLVRLD